MRQLFSFSLAITCLVLATGCDQTASKPDYYGRLSGKLEAALAISDASTRNSALVNLAAEGAENDDIKLVMIVLAKINDVQTKDSTAANCVDIFVKERRFDNATQVAKSITDTTARDAALKRVVGGDQQGDPAAPSHATAPAPMPPSAEAEEK